MQPPPDVSKILAPFTVRIDDSLQQCFAGLPEIPLYHHLAYFMGFRNEALEPEVTYGGKRFRSALMLMLGDWYGVTDAALPMATALELYHNFTLIHDDVVDRDTHRRGRPTVWHQFGVDHAINDGDAQVLLVAELLGRAAASTAQGPAAQAFLLSQFRKVIEGQYLDFTLTGLPLGDAAVTEAAYLTMIERKTADLIVAATGGAGILANTSETEQAALMTYGRSLGLAYQICDDVVSIWSSGEATGKRDYGDLKERKKTLPILFAFAAADAATRSELITFFNGTSELTNEDCHAIVSILDRFDTKPAMREVIDGHAAAAKAAAAELSIPEEAQATLVALVDSLLPSV